MKKMKKISFIICCLFLGIGQVYAAHADFMNTTYVSCGSGLIKRVPKIIPSISTSIYNFVLVAVPVILVIFGVIDLLKGIMSQKEDEIKKGRDSLIKRIIMGMVIFLIVMLVKLFINVIGTGDDRNKIISCIDCFIDVDNCEGA